MVPQFLTEGVLRDRLAELGARVEFGVELNAFDQDGDGVRGSYRRRRASSAARSLI
jgi:hypothetical protein